MFRYEHFLTLLQISNSQFEEMAYLMNIFYGLFIKEINVRLRCVSF